MGDGERQKSIRHRLIFEQGPRELINSREYQAETDQLLRRLLRYIGACPHFICQILHMQAFIALRCDSQGLKKLPCSWAHGRKRLTVRGRLLCASCPRICFDPILTLSCLWWSSAEEEVDRSRIKEMVIDLVVIRNRSNHMRTNMFPVVESLQLAPYPTIPVFNQLWPRVILVTRLIGCRHLAIVPLLDLDGTSAIIDFVGNVGGLGADVADLANKRDLFNGVSIL